MSSQYSDSVDNKYIAKVNLGADYETNLAVMKHVLDDSILFDGSDQSPESVLAAMPKYMLTAKYRDTSTGGNDAINCYYQFNENDDIVHKINQIQANPIVGMGRVYNETFDEQQQILYLTFGVPDFAGVGTFLQHLYDTDLAKLMNSGDVGILSTIGTIIGKTIGTVIKLPFLPIILLEKVASKFLSAGYQPTKYYELKPTMPLYYRMVNTILSHLAVNMNLTMMDEDGGNPESLPALFKEHGLDILTILSKKHWWDDTLGKINKLKSPTEANTDELLRQLAAAGEKNPMEFNNWGVGGGFNLATTQALDFVGFRIEKSVDSSESVSSSTKESEISKFINNQVSAGRDRTFHLGSLKETPAGEAINAVYESIKGIASGALSSFNINGGLEVLSGSGYIDIPEVWDNSQFSKSYSFDFQLRTPYGDKLSIFYSLYIPLAMLMAAAFPRSTGANSYTSPFLLRAYCQGMFAIPLGIIDSITIKRGGAEYGWSNDMLPTQIDISISIKDLSSVMHIAVGDSTRWMDVLGNNSAFQEYMLTLAGSNIAERLLLIKGGLLKKRIKVITSLIANNKLNPVMLGYRFGGGTSIGKIITALRPGSRLPGVAKLGG